MIDLNTQISQAESSPDVESAPEEIHPASGLNMLATLTLFVRGRWLVATVTGIAMLVGIVISFLLPVRYTATTKIMTPQQTQSSAAFMMSQLALNPSNTGSLAAAAGGALSLRNPNDLYLGLLTSRPVADGIIEKFGLVQSYHAKDMTAARRKLAENTTIISEKSTLISISVTDRDKRQAADIANAYREQLRELTKSLAITEASQRRLFYEQRLKDAKEDLITAELSLQQIQQEKGLIQLDAQTKALITALADLHAQVAAKEVQLQALRSYSTEQNPEVQLIESQLSSLQDQVARLEQRSGSSTYANLNLGGVVGSGADYLRAEHELQYRQALFDLLLKQYDAARWDESRNAAVIQVVEEAIPPDQKSAPKRIEIVLICTFTGMFLAFLFLFIRNFAADSPKILQLLAEFKSVPVSK